MLDDSEFRRRRQIGALRLSRERSRSEEDAVVRRKARRIRENEERNRAEVEVGDDLPVVLNALNLAVFEDFDALCPS